MDTLKLSNLLEGLPTSKFNALDILEEALKDFNKKIIVLDDDPTGVQTVHGIPVYTSWEQHDIDSGFNEPGMFFILTNSRGLASDEVKKINEDISKRICNASKRTGKDFVIISRSDSTLRGYYPLETGTIRKTVEADSDIVFSGEIICPFFIEGGRYTCNDIHYVLSGDILTPAGETEFAKDKSFSYSSSNLKDWIEEKTKGEFTKDTVTAISLDMIRKEGANAIYETLIKIEGFNKVIVNAVSYDDLRIFLAGYIKAVKMGKHFIFRSAAAIPKLLGGISDIPLLGRDELRTTGTAGGLVVIGSHVEKTSKQLSSLLEACDILPIEFNQHTVVDPSLFEAEQRRVQETINSVLAKGKDVVVFTRRERLDMNTGYTEDELTLTAKISAAVTGFVKNLTVKPSYIIAKGGITSSEIGTVGLGVKRAMVIGQVLPGIPVWRLGEESKFPNMAYIIFPGNVGEVDSLAKIVSLLRKKKLLIVVDYQNDFVNGSLGFSEAEKLDSVIVEKIKEYRKNNDDVVFTLDTHEDNYLETKEGQYLPIEHCIIGTKGHELYGKTAEQLEDSIVFTKNTFGSDKLFEFLRNSDYQAVELCGLVLGICVLSNAVLSKVALPEAEIVVDSSAAIGNDRKFDMKVLEILKGIHVKVI